MIAGRRESAYAALFNKLNAIPGWVTTGRIVTHWGKLAAVQQPALFLAITKQTSLLTADNLPTRWKLEADVYVYVRNDSANGTAPSTTLNALLDLIDAALSPAPGFDRQTLSGIVEHCKIAGTIETDDGALGDQAVAIIPVEMITS